MTNPSNASPVGFWRIPQDVWTDDEAMDDFAHRVSDQMTVVSEQGRDTTEGEQSQDTHNQDTHS